MRLLSILGGLYSRVDDEDFERLNGFNWHLSKRSTGHFYVVRSNVNGRKNIKIYLHRDVMNAKKGEIVDHKDRDVLNNQKSNLRFCTQSQNLMNRERPKSCSRNFRGVYKIRDRWFASIKRDGKTISLGGFSTERDAAIAYNNSAKSLHGEFATLNIL